MTFRQGTEEYYQKFIELQEKLRKSEEERLELEMKFNEMMQVTRDEEQAYYKKLRSQYKHFLEENRKRQERNEKLLRLLERVESRASMLEAKTQRIQFLRKQYHNYLDRISAKNRIRAESNNNLKSFNDQRNHDLQRESIVQQKPPRRVIEGHKLFPPEGSNFTLQSNQYVNPKQQSSYNFEPSSSFYNPGSEPSTSNYGASANSQFYPCEENRYYPNASQVAEDIMNSIRSRRRGSVYPSTTRLDSDSDSVVGGSSPNKRNVTFGRAGYNNESNQRNAGGYGRIEENCHYDKQRMGSGIPQNYFDDNEGKFGRPSETHRYGNNNDFENYGNDYLNEKFVDERNEIKKPDLRNYGNEKVAENINRNESSANHYGNFAEGGNDLKTGDLQNVNNYENHAFTKESQRFANAVQSQNGISNASNPQTNSELLKKELGERRENNVQKFGSNMRGLSLEDIKDQPRFSEDNQAINKNRNYDTIYPTEDDLSSKNNNKMKDTAEGSQQLKTANSERIPDNSSASNDALKVNQSNVVGKDFIPRDLKDENDDDFDESEKKQDFKESEKIENLQVAQNQYENLKLEENLQQNQFDLTGQATHSDQLEQSLGKKLIENKTHEENVHNNSNNRINTEEESYDGNNSGVDGEINADISQKSKFEELNENNEQPLEFNEIGQSVELSRNKEAIEEGDSANQEIQLDNNGHSIKYDQNETAENNKSAEFNPNEVPVQNTTNESGLKNCFDENGQPIQYDENAQPVQYDENGQAINYDQNNPPIQYDENAQQIQYDENGQPLSGQNIQPLQYGDNQPDNLDQNQPNQYDENGQQIQYDENGQIIQYDQSGQPIQYDENGQPIVYDPNNKRMNYDENAQPINYDENGQPIKYNGNAQPINYDENGQPINYDENGQPIKYDENAQPIEYDENGQPINYDENGQPIKYDENAQPINYDENGQPINYDENGQPIQYDQNAQPIGYDENNQPIQYDENGQAIQYDQTGQQIHYDQNGQPIQYDENGQPLQYDPNNQFNYDENGQLIQYDENGQVISYNNETSQEFTDASNVTFNENGEEKKQNVLDLLETDTESGKQDTNKVSNDSDFDFSNAT